MGTRSVSGNFTCYLNDTSEGSLQLFEDLQESRGVITNAFDLTFWTWQWCITVLQRVDMLM